MPSHTSAWGSNSPTQASHCVAFAMLLHVCTPCLHCPIEEPHACVAPRAQPHPSSISPSLLPFPMSIAFPAPEGIFTQNDINKSPSNLMRGLSAISKSPPFPNVMLLFPTPSCTNDALPRETALYPFTEASARESLNER